jgi:hypothetical protein
METFGQQMCLYLRSALFLDLTQRRVVILYRAFGTIFPSHLQGSRSPRRKETWISWPLKMGPIRFSETSVKDCHSTLRNLQDKRKCYQHCLGTLKSRMRVLDTWY